MAPFAQRRSYRMRAKGVGYATTRFLERCLEGSLKEVLLRGVLRKGLVLRNPFPPQICPKFVPAIFWGFQSGGPKSVENLSKFEKKVILRQILPNFHKFLILAATPKNNRWDKFWTNLGFGAFLNAVRGKGFRKPCKGSGATGLPRRVLRSQRIPKGT